MKPQTTQTTNQHQQIFLLLPWYVNQSLELGERQRVESHIRGCMRCRRELVQLGKLATAIQQAPDLDVAAEVSFNRLREQLQASRQQTSVTSDPSQEAIQPQKNSAGVGRIISGADHRHKPVLNFFLSQGTWLAIAASLLVAIVPIATLHGTAPVGGEFRTLSDAKPNLLPGMRLRVVFNKSMTDTDFNALLGAIHGERVEGPNSVGAYTIRINSDQVSADLASAIAFLREQQDVILAEPVTNQP